jgi:pimeloyl-ACP methyl ester carboxylesterase
VRARTLGALFLILVSVSACGGAAQPKLTAVPGKPGQLVELNGQHLYFECFGSGEPTVLLEAGYGGDHTSWDVIEPALAKTTRTCSYDRAGLGLSSAEQPKPRGPFDQLDDLDDLLKAVDIDPPYVVVGHSYGGILAWFFVRRHSDDVDGLLLLDSSHPRQVKRFRTLIPKRRPAPEVSPENVDFEKAAAVVGDPGSLGEVRLIVMTAGQKEESELSARLAQRASRIWRELQDDYATRSTDSIHVIARYSPHFIQSNLGQPDLVVRAIRELVSAARADRPLPPCRELFRSPGAFCVSG